MISENIVHFARVLRTAGLTIGPDRVLAAQAAVEAVGLNRRDDVHAALSAVMIDRHEQQVLFDAAFDAFWRDPKLLEQLMYLLLPKISGRGDKLRPPRANRLAEALAAPRPPAPPNPANDTAKEELQFETTFTFSDRERLAMSCENLTPVKMMLITLFDVGDMQTAYFLERRAPGVWSFYSLTRTRMASSLMPIGGDASYINRAVAFYRLVAAIPTDQEPPAAR